jgi:hypothetical protein
LNIETLLNLNARAQELDLHVQEFMVMPEQWFALTFINLS